MDDLNLYNCNKEELDMLVQATRIDFSKDIGMGFAIEKCAMLVREKGKIVELVGIDLPHGKNINRRVKVIKGT